MSEIVERLREYARNVSAGQPPEDYLTWQAAAEIERLRAVETAALEAVRYHKVGDEYSDKYQSKVMLTLMDELARILDKGGKQ